MKLQFRGLQSRARYLLQGRTSLHFLRASLVEFEERLKDHMLESIGALPGTLIEVTLPCSTLPEYEQLLHEDSSVGRRVNVAASLTIDFKVVCTTTGF